MNQQKRLDLGLECSTLALVAARARWGVSGQLFAGSPDHSSDPSHKDSANDHHLQYDRYSRRVQPTQSDWIFTAQSNQRAQTTGRARGLKAERNQSSGAGNSTGFPGNVQVLDPAIGHTSGSDGDGKNSGVKCRGRSFNLGTRCLPGSQHATGGMRYSAVHLGNGHSMSHGETE